MTNRQFLQKTIDESLTSAAFRRRGSRWAREHDEVLQWIALQQSQFGEQFYVNLGIWLKSIRMPAKFQEKDMHIRMRTDGVLQSIYREHLASALDFDQDLSSSERRDSIRRPIRMP